MSFTCGINKYSQISKTHLPASYTGEITGTGLRNTTRTCSFPVSATVQSQCVYLKMKRHMCIAQFLTIAILTYFISRMALRSKDESCEAHSIHRFSSKQQTTKRNQHNIFMMSLYLHRYSRLWNLSDSDKMMRIARTERFTTLRLRFQSLPIYLQRSIT